MSDSLKNCYIAAGTVIKGTVTANEDLRIDGTIIGNINATGRTVVGENGKVEGEVVSKLTEVSGHMVLDKVDTDVLKLNATANFSGDILTRELDVETGAVLNGNITMKGGTTKKIIG